MATTPPLRRRTERGDDDFAAGREGDGAVELDGRLRVFVADPGCAERRGGLAVRLAAGDDVDLAVPGLENADGERGGAAEAEEADALAGLDAGDAQAAEADDAGAEQRRGVDGVEAGGQRVGEVGAGEGVLGVAAVDGVAGEDGVVAEVLHAVAAEPAVAVDAADPGDADARAERKLGGGAVDDFADDLMAGDDARVERRKVALDDVEVGAADAAGEDAEEDVAGVRVGRGMSSMRRKGVDGARAESKMAAFIVRILLDGLWGDDGGQTQGLKPRVAAGLRDPSLKAWGT